MTDRSHLSLLGEVLDRLAAPAAAQWSYLTNLGVAPSLDELALEFDDAYRPARPTLVGLRGSALLMQSCDAVGDALSSTGLGWGFEDIDAAAWRLVRDRAQLAAVAIRSFREDDLDR